MSQCEIVVFGSNLEGQHMSGAARTAYEKFGAEWEITVLIIFCLSIIDQGGGDKGDTISIRSVGQMFF